MLRPASAEEAAQALRELGEQERTVRVRGGGTKLGWADADCDAELSTAGLARLVEHNAGDFTAVVEAGMALADAQAAFAEAGQMLALDPPDPGGATIGGVLATADSGPLRHRYGGARDVVIGAQVALSDGTLARSGGKVIKNVAGYDLGKLLCGSYGTLGLLVEVAVRLHPRPPESATAVWESDDVDALAGAAARLARLPLEADCLDVTWERGAGRVLVRFSGPTAVERAEAAPLDARVERDDAALWEGVRAGQRGSACLKVSGRPSELARVLRAARDVEGRVTARAALGLAWVALEGDALAPRVAAVRAALAPRACTLQDGAGVAERWPAVEPGALAVMRRVKARFDPARIFAPGAFAGGV